MEALEETVDPFADSGHDGPATERGRKREERIEQLRDEREDRYAAVVEKARQAGTLRADSTIVTRKVDPATIRPPGWEEIPDLTGKGREVRLAAICKLLKRGPMEPKHIWEALRIKPTPYLIEKLIAERRIRRVELSAPEQPIRRVVQLVTEEERMQVPANVERLVGGPLEIDLPKPSTNEQKVDVVERILSAGPRPQTEIGRMLRAASADVSHILSPAFTTGRLEKRPAPRRPGVSGRRSPIVALPGDVRTEPDRQVVVRVVELEWECALDGCDVVFKPANPKQRYHSPRCSEAATRKRGTQLDEPRPCGRCGNDFVREAPAQEHCPSCRDEPRPPRGQPLDAERDCKLATCESTFVPDSPRQEYCSGACRREAATVQGRESARRRRAAETPPTPEEPPVPATAEDTTTRDRYLDLLESLVDNAERGPRRDRLVERHFRLVQQLVERVESQEEEDALLDRIEQRL